MRYSHRCTAAVLLRCEWRWYTWTAPQLTEKRRMTVSDATPMPSGVTCGLQRGEVQQVSSELSECTSPECFIPASDTNTLLLRTGCAAAADRCHIPHVAKTRVCMIPCLCRESSVIRARCRTSEQVFTEYCCSEAPYSASRKHHRDEANQ